jgi:hypothetical protein
MMTMNQVWLTLVAVVSHTVQLASSTNIIKNTCPSGSFHLDKSSPVLSALLVVRNWQSKLWFQES